MERVFTFIVDRPKLILFLIALLTLFFAFHARHIRLDSSVESLLPRDDPEKTYYAEVRRLFGSGVIGVVTDNIYTPAVLHKIRRLTDEIKQIEGVENVISVTNTPDAIIDIIPSDGDLLVSPEGYVLDAPQEREKTTLWEHPERLDSVIRLIAQEAQNFSRVVNQDFSRTAIVVRTTIARASDVLAMVDKIHTFAQEHFPPELKVHATGNLILHSRTINDRGY